MARSDAPTVEQYLGELPDDRREVVAAVRDLILEHLPPGYQEEMNWGMISYQVPLDRYPNTYNGQPLMFAALAAQKRAYSLYLTLYGDAEERLRAESERAGKRLDMGKSCVRFRRVGDLPLDVIGKLVERTPVEEFVRRYEASRGRKA